MLLSTKLVSNLSIKMLRGLGGHLDPSIYWTKTQTKFGEIIHSYELTNIHNDFLRASCKLLNALSRVIPAAKWSQP